MDATACTMRVNGFNVVIASQWADPPRPSVASNGRARRCLAHAALAPTRYVNYLEDDAVDPATVAYGPNLARLRHQGE